MFTCLRKEQGFAYIMVFMILIIVSASVIAISAGLRTQTNVSAVSDNSSIALAEAEKGLAVGFVRKKSGDNFTKFTLNDNGWTITVNYTSGSPNILESTATSGRYSRTTSIEVTTASNPLNQYDFVSGGTVKFQNGSYNLGGTSVYANTCIIIDASGSSINSKNGTTVLPTTVSTPGQVQIPSWMQQSQLINNGVTPVSGAAPVSIPDVNWDAFSSNPSLIYKSYTNVSSNLNISADLLACTGSTPKIILVEVSGGSPVISTGGQNFSNSNAIIVVKKTASAKSDPNCKPQLSLTNGTYGTSSNPMKLTAFVDGTINFNSVAFYSIGSFYGTGAISVTSGSYNIRGGVASKGDITPTGVDFTSTNANWDSLKPYFILSGASRQNWKEK